MLEPLPPDRGHKRRSVFDNRRIVNAILWRHRTGDTVAQCAGEARQVDDGLSALPSDARGFPFVFHLTPGEAADSHQRAN